MYKRNTDQLSPKGTLIKNQNHRLGICLGWESNWQPFCAWNGVSTQLSRTGQCCHSSFQQKDIFFGFTIFREVIFFMSLATSVKFPLPINLKHFSCVSSIYLFAAAAAAAVLWVCLRISSPQYMLQMTITLRFSHIILRYGFIFPLIFNLGYLCPYDTKTDIVLFDSSHYQTKSNFIVSAMRFYDIKILPRAHI